MAAHHYLTQEEFDAWIADKQRRSESLISLEGRRDATLALARIWGEADRQACKGDGSFASLSACEDSSAGLYLIEHIYRATKSILPNVMFWSLLQIALLGFILWRVW
ncbi:hypothetical protein [Amaricoccus sp.]|uniref:hypothetical protein n=1 Tax=Amaricoccus sp. TaxID=1872485 RepID=UPI001B76F3A9|nr:hypothetical protein [Amaricoccus sp.]MBP7002331.1 hypothetical protein [Amaricoccus sp.]